MKTRTLLAALTGVAVLLVTADGTAQTYDDYPNRPIRIIVPQAAGSGVDLQARVTRAEDGRALGSAGRGGEPYQASNAIIGMEAAAKAQPDGYTLVYAPVSAVTMNPFIFKKLPYEPLRDFIPITQTTANPLGAVVNPASGIKSIKDLVERAKAQPGRINYGSFGIGIHDPPDGRPAVARRRYPYGACAHTSGQTPAITDVLSGQIPLDLHDHGRRDGFHGKREMLNLLATFGE